MLKVLKTLTTFLKNKVFSLLSLTPVGKALSIFKPLGFLYGLLRNLLAPVAPILLGILLIFSWHVYGINNKLKDTLQGTSQAYQVCLNTLDTQKETLKIEETIDRDYSKGILDNKDKECKSLTIIRGTEKRLDPNISLLRQKLPKEIIDELNK